MTSYDLLGNIAIIKGEGLTKKEKLEIANEVLKHPNIKTVVEKSGNVHGRLRTIDTKYIAGDKNLVAVMKENDCVFKFDIEKCYFSSRLSEERKILANKIKSKDRVLVMFAGVGVYPIVIYKIAKPVEIVSVELGKECCKFANENLNLNKIPEGKIKVIQGDVKKKVNESLGKFDVIVMARPNLKDTFFKEGLSVAKKGTLIYYYGFCHLDKKDSMIEELKTQAEEVGRKIKIINVEKAGDIAPFKFRWRVDIRVFN